jgi:hypothetical protein
MLFALWATGVLSGLMANPSMIGAHLNDPRMQLVSGAVGVAGLIKAGKLSRAMANTNMSGARNPRMQLVSGVVGGMRAFYWLFAGMLRLHVVR